MFEPWIGSRYGDKANVLAGLRFLILGESHYTHTPDEVGLTHPEFTHAVVEDLAISKRYRFFTNLLQIVSNRKRHGMSQEDVTDFWSSVAFYNYVPVLVDGTHRRPTDQMFRSGAAPFQSILKQLAPSAVLVCGDRLWGWVAPNIAGVSDDHWNYAYYNDGLRVFGRIHHPGMAFSSDRWAPRVQKLIELARQPSEIGGVTWTDENLGDGPAQED